MVLRMTARKRVLAIISPSQAISWKEDAVFGYAPALPIEACHIFSSLFASHDHARAHPDYPPSVYGTVTSRMQIAVSNLRKVFGTLTLAELKEYYMKGLNCLTINGFSLSLPDYFVAQKHRKCIDYHRLFACYSVSPYIFSKSISFVSVWVESQANTLLFTLKDKRDAEQILRMKNWITQVFGLKFLTGSIRGCLFADLCHALITRKAKDIPEHHFELVDVVSNRGTV
jgi:hypothetical protein